MSQTENTSQANQLYRAMLRWQMLVTLAVSLIAAMLVTIPAAISALLGGTAVIIGAWFAAKIAENGKNKTQPTAILLNLLKAEAVKILIIAIIVFVVFKLYQALVPFALIAGLAAAALFSGAAMTKTDANV